MAQTEEAVVRFRKLFEQECFQDLSWAEELQERMRRQGLVRSGRPVSATLRPEVLSRPHLEKLRETADGLSAILQRVEPLILSTPALLNRLGMLPVEKMLVNLEIKNARSCTLASIKAHRQNGSLRICDYDTCGLHSLMYSDQLADLFLSLPSLQAFSKGRYRLSKIGGSSHLFDTIRQSWSDSGEISLPQVAVLESSESIRSNSSEGRLLVQKLSESGLAAQLLSPDQLEYSHGHLHAGEFRVDVVLRRMLTRELLVAHDLSHPLLSAYRDGTVCVINPFLSGLTQRRALFELLTDGGVLAKLSSADAQFLRRHIPWTRVVGQRKVVYKDESIDLYELAIRDREQFVLRPNDVFGEGPTFVGERLNAGTWEAALRAAMRTPYVLQERSPAAHQSVPIFQYGEMQRKAAKPCFHPQLFNGKMLGVSAAHDTCIDGCEVPLTLAPVLLLDAVG